MDKSYEISYGSKKIKINLPMSSKIQLMKMKKHKADSDVNIAAQIALENPVGSKKLRYIVKKGNKVCIIIPDRTRPVPVKELLEVVLKELHESAIKKEDIIIVFALGTHRMMNKNEMKEIVGQDILEEYECINHNWQDKKNLVSLSYSKKGVPIVINKVVYESDIKIAIGGVNPHRVAGWSGGAKAIVPGVSGEEITGYTHWLSALLPAEEIYGVEDNPVRKEMELITKKVGLDFIVNCVGNEEYKPVVIYAGNYIEAHRKCVKEAKKIYEIKLNEKKDIVISGTGACVSDMWNTGCGPGELIIKNGGISIVFSPCKDGISPQHPEIKKFGYLHKLEEVKKLVERGEIKDLAAAAHLIHAGDMITRKSVKCILVSEGISKEDANSLGIHLINNPQKAIDQAFLNVESDLQIGIYDGFSSNYLYYV
jgi:lactate racemase